MIRNDLHDGWTLHAEGHEPLPATVPGTAHTDLLAAGLIPDPYHGVNEAALTWMHRATWLYETTLAAAPAAADERADLVFDGLDTVATVTLGGDELGKTANMHRSYRFDVRHALRSEGTPLSVRFDPALEYAEEIASRLGARPSPYPHPFNAVRKMACSFGWDWGPDLQTAGIWKPVRLERWRVARLARTRVLATLDADGRTGKLLVGVEAERSGLAPARALRVRISVRDVTAEISIADGDSSAAVTLTVEDAPVWWPAGYGDQPLSEAVVELLDEDGTSLDSVKRRVGFRSVALDESPDGAGHRFVLIVNGQEVFARGLNWIPEDHLLTRLTRDRYAAAIDRAAGANANLLRVWGGGIYESDDFYDVCDERGILVWQDFPLACAAYAEEDPIRPEILAEARENIVRLGSHASLAIWNGGNENIWGHEDWGWKAQLGDLTWGARYYYEDFPQLLAALDPTRPYHPGSPSSPGFDPADVHPNDERYGTRHEWAAWNNEDYTYHDNFAPRFCSEFGWQAPPTWATLTAAIDAADLHKDSAAFLLHQKAAGGNDKLDAGLARHMAVPTGFADWHWATQLNQARATTYAVNRLRALAPHTMGSIVWQLNDCWPVTSWALVDGGGRRKPAWYALRRAYAPRLLTFGPGILSAVNDSADPWRSTARLRRMTFDGKVLASTEIDIEVAPRTVSAMPLDPDLIAVTDPTREVLVADAGSLRATHLFAEDFDLAYAPDAIDAVAARVPGGVEITVTASSFARDVAVLADRVDPSAAADDMLVDLLPGETRTFTVSGDADVDPAAFTAPLVLRSAG